MSNIYYSPEAYGLTVVGEIEMYDGGYGFDTTVLWQDGAGKYFWAHDSGCSCPSPFEDYNLSNVSSGTLNEFKSFAKAKAGDWWEERKMNDFNQQLQDIILRANRKPVEDTSHTQTEVKLSTPNIKNMINKLTNKAGEGNA